MRDSEDDDKLIVVLGTRLRGKEAARWERLLEECKKRERFFDKSKLLRDILFGEYGVVTDQERNELRGILPFSKSKRRSA